MAPREMFVWCERYRPKTIEECILPKDVKAALKGILAQQDTPNLLFHGRSGTGKTTVAWALTRALDSTVLMINASMENGIDVLRNRIADFATTLDLSGKRKFVILDEADYLSQAAQPALRNFTEEFAGVCGFIFTCNYPQRIIPALHSRCSAVDFRIPASERGDLAAAFCKRALDILKAEKVTAKKEIVVQVIATYFPDFRRVLNELQRHSSTGTLSEAILAVVSDRDIQTLFDCLKKKAFGDLRKWLVSHEDMDQTAFYHMLYEQMPERLTDDCLPQAIVMVADYAARALTSADQQLNALACLVELMNGANWR